MGVCTKFCQKVERALLITIILLMVANSLLIIGMYVIYKRVKESQWLDPEDESYGFQVCVVFYFIFYFIATVLVVIRMVFRKKMCGLATAIFMVMSIVLIIMGGALASQLTEDSVGITMDEAQL